MRVLQLLQHFCSFLFIFLLLKKKTGYRPTDWRMQPHIEMGRCKKCGQCHKLHLSCSFPSSFPSKMRSNRASWFLRKGYDQIFRCDLASLYEGLFVGPSVINSRKSRIFSCISTPANKKRWEMINQPCNTQKATQIIIIHAWGRIVGQLALFL